MRWLPGRRTDIRGLNPVEFAGLDRGRYDGPVLRACVMTCEKCIFAVEGNGADRALDRSIADFDAAIFNETAQALPVFCDVFQSLPGWGFGRDAGAALGEPELEVIDDGFCVFLPRGAASVGTLR